MRNEHRIDPDYADREIDGMRRLIADALAAQRVEIENQGGAYHEFPKVLVKWLAGGIMALVVSGIASIIVMYGELQGVRAELYALRSELNDLKRLVEPRYRGEPNGSPQ